MAFFILQLLSDYRFKGMRHLRIWTIAAAALLLGFMGAQAGTLTGQVYDKDTDKALTGANVVLRSSTGGLLRYGSSTDQEGRFRFNNVHPGNYQLKVTFLGYTDYTKEVRVTAADSVQLAVGLSATALPQEEVLVSAGRAQAQLTPITASNLTLQEIKEQSGMKDLPVMLSQLPSVTYHSQNGNGVGYSTLRMRGFGQRRIAVSINGIPQNDPEDFNVYWINFFDIQGAIQDIQVQRGAGASFYGPVGIGGAVNIIAKPYRPQPYAKLHLGYGSFNTQRYTVEANSGRIGGKYVVYGRLSRLLSDGYRDWSWSTYYRYFAGISRYGKNSTLTLQSYGGPQHDGLAYLGVPKAANQEEELRRANAAAYKKAVSYFKKRGPIERFHQPHVELLHSWRFAPNAMLDQSLFWIKGEGYFDYGVNYRSADYLRLPEGFQGLGAKQRKLPLFMALPTADVKLRGYLDQHQVGWLPKVTWEHNHSTTTLGLEARLHRSLRWGRIQEANQIIPSKVVGGDDDKRIYSYRGEKIIAAVMGKHLWRPVNRLAVQGELQLTYRRYRHYDETFWNRTFTVPYLFANPRLGITINPNHSLSGYISAALAQREPRLSQLYYGQEAGAGAVPRFKRRPNGSINYDRPLVTPESLFDLELGGTLQKRWYRLTANLFWMEFWNEIIPSGGVDQFGRSRTGNADRTRHRGLELEASARLLPGWDVSFNSTLSRNRFVSFTEYVTINGSARALNRSGNPIAGFPERMAKLRTSYRWNGWSAAVDLKYAGQQFVDNSGGREADGQPAPGRKVKPYTLVNASLGYEPQQGLWLHGLRLNLSANNLLNRRVLRYGYMSAAGARFFPAATRHFFLSLSYRLN